jgi:glucosamine-6-phosphate deaminase
MFHLDEYIGLPITAKASFRKYLKERFIDNVPALKAAHLINGENDPVAECKRLGDTYCETPYRCAHWLALARTGILLLMIPRQILTTDDPYIIVDLDEACRKQQFNEGWFDTMDDVPRQAISMSIQQIMKSKQIICSVPDSRKAEAVRNSLEEPVTNEIPASILREHACCSYLSRY